MFSIVREYTVAIRLHASSKKYTNKCKKNLKFSGLVGTAIKVLKQAAEMEHELSACILIPFLVVYKYS